ncbi:hypothetical protein LEP1GSC079_3697 [Leptospira interrogans str. FPW1039]|uniref:Uncharacterized protein n=1 Tax=Leptospira interrogans str. FPW1039 TaxID=1193040 RepID=A0A0F6IJZ8_LEPIR|nr:hypothetical protein LEP1GSC007_2581 [Leptospira interrogans serovar Bulgarica str. Mallika]EKO69990.1 hypothetical protein LEP1GSC069_2496 [Leptospira interrogans serovar Canicola str. Fiocruz LV133]EKR25049.1 hypothetical protein LEP1GSC087_1419 [Leptospira interrogans serovar Bataviae str. L1111]EMJ38373.1 hypothetical protein LEP1GSC079_3697 [Leptospira interrogans str. FPW1039]EMK16111.1 hypothetical protein LEP1GSC075_0659 [Leptospira interrogans str. Kito]EMN75951.1 hypothetical prot
MGVPTISKSNCKIPNPWEFPQFQSLTVKSDLRKQISKSNSR